MRWSRLAMSGAAVLLAMSAHAQMLKPGLWDYTSTMQMEGMPQIPPEQLAKMQAMGIKVPGGGQSSRFKMCMTKEMIDKYGGTAPQQNQSCHVENVQMSTSGMKATLVCSGENLNGTGTVEATRVDDNHSQGKAHFKGTMKNGRPLEWTSSSSSTFLSPDCGDIQPGHPVAE
jgi:hypothetical protein